jgi:hypothetical protein
MKTFKEYINGIGYSWNDFDRTYEIEHLIEQYADEKVKLALDTSSVIGRSELNEKAKNHLNNAGFGIGTNITLHGAKCIMVDFYLDNQYKKK